MPWPVYEGDKSVMFFFFFLEVQGLLEKAGNYKSLKSSSQSMISFRLCDHPG